MDYSWMTTAKAELKTGRFELPNGTYNVYIESFNNYQTKNGGRALKVVYKVLDGQQEGRSSTQFYNLPDTSLQKTNPNAFEAQKNNIITLAYWVGGEGITIMEFIKEKNYPSYTDKKFKVEVSEFTKKDGTKGKSFDIKAYLGKLENMTEAPDPFANDNDPFGSD